MKKAILAFSLIVFLSGCGAEIPSQQENQSKQPTSSSQNNNTNSDGNQTNTSPSQDSGDTEEGSNTDDNEDSDQADETNDDDANRVPLINTETLSSANEDEEYTFVLDISDPDGDSFSTSIEEGPVGLSLSGNSLNWLPRQADVGTHTIRISATDSQGGSTEKTFELVVLNVNDPPTISNFNNVVVDEGQTVTLSSVVEDEDGDNVELAYSGWMTSNTRATNFSDSGTYSVTLTASDGLVSTSQTITVFVNDVNTSPTISGAANMTVNEGDLITLSPSVTDAEGDQVEISYSGWMTSNTRQTDFDDAGIYEVTITASDGRVSTDRTIQITVLNVNRPPVIIADESFTMNEGGYLNVSISVSDPDGDAVNVSVEEALPANMTFHQAPSAIVFEPIHNQSGVYDLTIVATDAGEPELGTSQVLTIAVNDTLDGLDEWEIVAIAPSSCNCDPKIDAGIVFYCSAGEIYKYENSVTTRVSPDDIVDNVLGRPCPQTHNGRATWQANGRIYYYDGNETTDLEAGELPRIHGTNVVWSNGGDIYIYDGISETTTRLTDNSPLYISRDILPNIYNDHIVWTRARYERPRGSGRLTATDLVYYSDGEEQILASSVSGDTPASIGPTMISWIGNWLAGDTSRYEIFAYDGNEVLQLTNNGIWDGNPYVTATDDIVWAEHFGNHRILRYTNGITSVEDEGHAQSDPIMEGNLYTWRRGRDGGSDETGWWDIVAKKNNVIYRLYEEPGMPGYPDTDGANVVWRVGPGRVSLARPR